MIKKASLFWVDLEMTGLDPRKDAIMEVAAIATDWSLESQVAYEGIVAVPEKRLKELIQNNGDFWNAHPKARDGLLRQNKLGRSLSEIESDLIKFIDDNFNLDKPIYLAGNSVHMDQKFMEENWPTLMKKLHYRILDVSAWKIVFENKFKKLFTKPEEHRALKDIEGSIDELKYYLKLMGKK